MARDLTDRRVLRTREMLQRALISLTLEKGYEAITVADICEAADVGRSTFYAHYTGKDDLKRSGLERHLRRLLAQPATGAPEAPVSGQMFGFSLTLLEHANDHRDLYRALAGSRGGAISLGAIRQILSDLVRRELPPDNALPNAIPRDLVVEYVVGAYMSVLTWWLDGGAAMPPDQIDAMFRHLTTDGIATRAGSIP